MLMVCRESSSEYEMTRIEKAIFWFAIVNFAVCAAMGLAIGVAEGGPIINGHYYLNNHGSYNEVSRAVYIFSRIQTFSVIPGLGVAAYVAYRARRRKLKNGSPHLS